MTNAEQPRNSFGKKSFIIAFVVVTLGVAGYSVWTNLAQWRSADAVTRSNMPHSENKLDIVSGNKNHLFNVEVMRTDTDRAKGLMFRQSMPEDSGMLFDFGTDLPVSMWMKNTYIPLDMLFILKDGTIFRIAERTEPFSEQTISAGTPVRAVLEINGGVAEKLGIKAGDRILHPMFPAK